jgi:Histone-like transcription factor (CBF/NF-Y) and archaeal histone
LFIKDAFWTEQQNEIRAGVDIKDKDNQLPLARIKKLMKSDEDVKQMMISANGKCDNVTLCDGCCCDNAIILKVRIT